MVGHGSELRQVDLCWRLFGAFKERGRGEKHGTNASSSPVLCASKGRRRHMVPFKMTLFLLLFFFSNELYETTSFFPKRVVSFKWKLAPKRVRFKIRPSICVPFHLGHWFWISSIKSLIGHQTSIFMQLSP